MSNDLPTRDKSGKSEAAVQGAVGSGMFVALQGGNPAGLRTVGEARPDLKVIEGGKSERKD